MAGEPDLSGVLTAQMMKSASNEFDIESIHTLSLTRMDLHDISAITGCMAIERLDLSYNDLNRLHCLSSLSNLATLDLSANRITSLDGLQSLDKLESLNLAGNLIGSIDALKPLVSLESLVKLRLRDVIRDIDNPVCRRETYREEVIRLLRLTVLDGEILKGPEAEVFTLMASLEQQLTRSNSPGGPTKTVEPPAALPADLFIRPTPPEVTADQQFKSALASCQSLVLQSRKVITEAEKKLKETEKV